MSGPLRSARMSGSSIAAPGAAAWVTDFLNAAYHARPARGRDVDDLRLAHCILTTRWARAGGRRLGARDLPAFHRAFAAARLSHGGRLRREDLLEGGARLLGDWFPGAYQHTRLRAHGIAFPTVAERRAFHPSVRLRNAPLRDLTPPERPEAERHWGAYPPVPLPDAGRALAFLRDPARWPDMGSAGGRFTALRPGGLKGQTFEIEVVAQPAPRAPLATRGYVTCTGLFATGRPLARAVAYTDAMSREHGGSEALPDGGRALALVELTTHEGHFLGRAISRLLVFEDGEGRAFIRDVGCWDPLPPHLAAGFTVVGRRAQAAFWGPKPADASMMVQLARVTAP